MDEERRERRIDAVSNEPSHAARVVALPHRVRWQDDIRGPARDRAGRKEDRVADGLVAAATPIEHSRQHRHVEVGIVVDAHLSLAVVEPMESARVLRDRASPRDRQRQKQRVQARIVESLSDVFAGGKNDSCFIARDGCQPIGHGLPLLLTHPRSQYDDDDGHRSQAPARERRGDRFARSAPAANARRAPIR